MALEVRTLREVGRTVKKTGILKCTCFVRHSKCEPLEITSSVKILAKLYNEILIFGTLILLFV